MFDTKSSFAVFFPFLGLIFSWIFLLHRVLIFTIISSFPITPTQDQLYPHHPRSAMSPPSNISLVLPHHPTSAISSPSKSIIFSSSISISILHHFLILCFSLFAISSYYSDILILRLVQVICSTPSQEDPRHI